MARASNVREAAGAAGIEVIQFVHEPLAALYAWMRGANPYTARQKDQFLAYARCTRCTRRDDVIWRNGCVFREHIGPGSAKIRSGQVVKAKRGGPCDPPLFLQLQ